MTAPVSSLVPSAFVAGAPVAVESISLSLDEAWSPYATTVVVVPYSAALFAALDPRTAPRVQVQIERRWHGGLTIADLSAAWTGLTIADLSTLWTGLTIADLSAAWGTVWDSGLQDSDTIAADLVVRARDVDYVADTITIRATSDELLAQDVTVGGVILPSQPLPDRVVTVLALAGLTVTDTSGLTAGAIFVAMPAETTTWNETLWDALQRMVNSVGLRLWCDQGRVWRLIDPLAAIGTTVTVGGVERASDSTNRDGDYANQLVFIGTGINPSGQTLTDTQVYPPTQPANPKVAVQRKDYGAVGAGVPVPSSTELAARLALLSSQARSLELVAPADPNVRPTTNLNTGLPSLPAAASIAGRVQWDVPGDTMTIRTRATT